MGLTNRQIRAAQTKEGLNQSDLRDDQVRGLILRVYKSPGSSATGARRTIGAGG